MLMRFLLGAALGAAVVAGPGAARADESSSVDHGPDPDFEGRSEGSRVALTTDIWPAQHFDVAAMDLAAQIAVHPHVALDFDVPWVVGDYAELHDTRPKTAAFGNITFGAHGMGHPDPDTVVHGGLTVSIPTRYDFTSASSRTVLVQGLGGVSRGYVDAYRLMPGVLSVRIPLGVETRFARYFRYRGEINPMVWAPVGHLSWNSAALYANTSVVVMVEHADEIEARAPFGFGGGLRFQAVFVSSSDGSIATGGTDFGTDDHLQTALEPFIGYEPQGTGFFARLGLLLALDTPLGFGFDHDKLAAVRIQLGGKF